MSFFIIFSPENFVSTEDSSFYRHPVGPNIWIGRGSSRNGTEKPFYGR